MACLKSRLLLLFSLSVLSFLSFAADAKSVRGIGFRPETEAPTPATEAPKPETKAPVPATEAPEPVPGPPEEPVSEPVSEPVEEPVEEPAIEVPQTPEDAMNFVEVLSLDPDLNFFSLFFNDTALDVVTEGGPFTVFAPTNDAFPFQELEGISITQDKIALWIGLFHYHIVPGIVMIDSVKDGDTFSTLFHVNQTITFRVKDDGVVTVNDVVISTSDIVTSDGVIHKIDGILEPVGYDVLFGPQEEWFAKEPATEVPKELATEVPETPEDVADEEPVEEPVEEPAIEVPETPEDAMNLLEVASLDPDLAFLLNVVSLTGLESIVTTTGPFTVFAPTNDAFLKVLEKPEDIALVDPQILLTILTYHVVPGKVMIGRIKDGDILPTVMGETIKFRVKDDGVVTVNDVVISTSDIVTSNGVIHKIDEIMFPQIVLADEEPVEEPAIEVPETPEDAMNLLEVASLDPDLAFLLNVVSLTGLESIVTTTGPFTVFAPTNDAFLKVLEKPEDIALVDPQILLIILTYHVVPGKVMIGRIKDGDILPTVMGETIKFRVKDDGVVTVNDVVISTSDIVTSNGVIHKIDEIMFPQIVLSD